jgi:hypothetical protein
MNLLRVAPILALVMTATLKAQSAVEISIDITALELEPLRERRALMQETTALWQPCGVHLMWVQSTVARALPRPTLALEVVSDNRESAAGRKSALVRLGSTSFRDADGSAEPALRLSVPSVQRLVDETKWAGRPVADWPPAIRQELIGRALGRVLAHEIGHFLLAWRLHTPRGLMRAQFNGTELVDPDRRMFTMPADLLPRLQAHLEQLTGRGKTMVAVE